MVLVVVLVISLLAVKKASTKVDHDDDQDAGNFMIVLVVVVVLALLLVKETSTNVDHDDQDAGNFMIVLVVVVVLVLALLAAKKNEHEGTKVDDEDD